MNQVSVWFERKFEFSFPAELFRAERPKLLERLDDMDKSLFARTILHPRLKTPMRLVDHLYFVAEHDDHHLARIWELVNS